MQIRDHVAWQWGSGLAEGIIVSIHPERTEIISKGKRNVRNSTAENPAVVIRHISGTKVLKLASEIQITR